MSSFRCKKTFEHLVPTFGFIVNSSCKSQLPILFCSFFKSCRRRATPPSTPLRSHVHLHVSVRMDCISCLKAILWREWLCAALSLACEADMSNAELSEEDLKRIAKMKVRLVQPGLGGA
jgi:hypothetical protein